jgi:hypothetical protein
MMQERDEAQSRLVQAEILHKIESEELSIRVSDLASQLAAAKRSHDSPSDKDDIHTVSTTTNQHHLQHQNKAIYDSDLELQSLCQQLAGEISARTAAELAIVRMKESRTLEQEIENTNRRALQNEVKELRALVQQMSVREKELVQESRMWRDSFDALLQYKYDASNSSNHLPN